MCGIVAVMGERLALAPLLHAVAPRGPDHLGWAFSETIAVGAARLRIHGGPEGDMPLHSTSGLVSVVMNGEIFNHRDLFLGEGSDLRGLADLWEKEGPSVLDRLRGPFALAVLDRRGPSLTIARDEYGVRPLHYAREGDRFFVASDAPILQQCLIDRRQNVVAFDHLLAFHFLPNAATCLMGVQSLSPGTWLRATLVDGRLHLEGSAFTCRLPCDPDLGQELRTAVRLQADRQHTSAIFLSGGVDSSAVLGLLARAGALPTHALVGYFPDGRESEDERPFARAVAKECGIELTEVAIGPAEHLAALGSLLRVHGGPEAGPGGPSAWCLAQRAATLGAKIVYTGQGGDELFGGYERHRQIALRQGGDPESCAPGYENLLNRDRDPVSAALFRGHEYLALAEPERRSGMLRAVAQHLPVAARGVDAVMEFEIRTLLPGLLAVDDRAIASFGMESRVPLLDPVLARAARGIPYAEKSPVATPRSLFRKLAGDDLPAAARQRTDKMGFPVPLQTWLSGPWRAVWTDPSIENALIDLGFRRGALRGGLHQLSPRGLWFLLASAMAVTAAKSPSEWRPSRVAYAS